MNALTALSRSIALVVNTKSGITPCDKSSSNMRELVRTCVLPSMYTTTCTTLSILYLTCMLCKYRPSSRSKRGWFC